MLRSLYVAITVLLAVASMSAAQSPDSARLSRSPAGTEHVDALFHGHGFDETGGLHFGSPAVVSAAYGAKYWLGDYVPGALFVTVEPGVLAFRYGVGYQLYDGRLYGAGIGLRFGQLRGWRDALGVTHGVQYTGGDVILSGFFAFSARLGAYQGRAGDGRMVQLATIDVGLGF